MNASPAEWKLLLACARLAVHDRAPAALTLPDVSWTRLLALADQHGLIPHLHRLVADLAVPADIRAQLVTQARQIARQNLHMTGELHRVLGELGAAGIDAISFKGPALATELYGAVGMRQFSDLDLLVAKPGARRAIELLCASGYRHADAYLRAFGPQTTSLKEIRLLHEARRVAVEIHWGLVDPITGISPDLDGCRQRARSSIIAGKPARVLAHEDQVLLLALHGAAHDWSRLGWLCDLARLVRTDTAIDWAVVADRARALGCERLLGLALALCQALLAVPVPAAVRQRSGRDRLVPALAGYVAGKRIGRHPGGWRSALLRIAVRERPRDQVRIAALTLFRPSTLDHHVFGLPPWLWPVAGALRPVRLLLRHGLAPLVDR